MQREDHAPNRPGTIPVSLGQIQDGAAAAQLMRNSWSLNPGASPDYAPEFFQACLEYPLHPGPLAPAYFRGNSVIAMVFGLPRRVLIAEEERKLLLLTFFSVAPECKGRGLGSAIWAECLRQAHGAEYDGTLHYCVEGNVSNHVTVVAAERAGYNVRRIFSVSYLIGRVPGGSDQTRKDTAPLVRDFMEAAQSAPHASLHRLWTKAEADWHCARQPNAFSVSLRSGDGVGALAGYTVPLVGETRTRSAVIDDVLWQNIKEPARDQLVHECLCVLAESADVVSVPILNHADVTPFKKAGFRRSMRTVHAYLTTWTAATITGCESLYMDVI